MAENKKSFLLYADLIHVVRLLPNKKAGELFKMILNYANGLDVTTDDLLLELVFTPIKIGMDEYWNRNNPGELHWNWKGGVSTENQKIRNGPEIKKWRSQVFERDGFTCQRCFIVGGVLHGHHKKEFSKFPELRFDVDNGLTLCRTCHHLIHKKND